MPQSRKNSDRKQQSETYKAKRKLMNKTQQFAPQPEQNPVRQSPVWNAADIMEISGAELKTLLDFVEQSTAAFYSINGVMSRNIVNGKIKLKFEKFDKATNDYVDMTPEEEAPYQEEVAKAIQAATAVQNGAIVPSQEPGPITAEEQKDLPRIDALVDKNGNPYPETDAPNLTVV